MRKNTCVKIDITLVYNSFTTHLYVENEMALLRLLRLSNKVRKDIFDGRA